MAIPAKAYATDWSYLLFNSGIVLAVPVIVLLFIPFYRRLNVTTAYEYLEARFNPLVRILCSIAFILFQIGRMGVVLLLPSIALNVVTGFDIFLCITLMGVLSLAYTLMGGIEAVAWTEALQVVVLLGAAVTEAERLFPAGELAPPPSVERVEICLTTGKRATHSCYDIDPVDKKYRRHTMFEYLRKGDSSLPFCDLHGEDISAPVSPFTAQNRILPLPPILPTKAILQGDDPYHTELNQGPANRNYELLGAGENVPEAQALSADPVSPDHTDTSITLPAPKPITIPVPEFIHL